MVGAFLSFGDLDDNIINRPPDALFYSRARVEDFNLREVNLVLTHMQPSPDLHPNEAVRDLQTLIWFAKAIWMRGRVF